MDPRPPPEAPFAPATSSGSAAAAAAPLLELQGVGKSFGRTEVLRGVDLSLHRGERLALIGPNGAGKSTLFDLISGRLRPSAGRVLLNGLRIDGRPPQSIARLGLARSFQSSRLFGRLSVHDNLRCAALWRSGAGYRLFGARAAQRRADAVALHWLARLELQARAELAAAQLAYAEQRLLDIGLALASGAELLLLDEPFNGLDRENRGTLLALVRELREEGRTVIVSTHDLEIAQQACTHALLLSAGHTPEQPGHPASFGPVAEALTLEAVEHTFQDGAVEIDGHTIVTGAHEHGAHEHGAHEHRARPQSRTSVKPPRAD